MATPLWSAFQFEKNQIIQDDEVEDCLVQILKPLFKKAGISIHPRIIILVNPEINAGATYGGIIVVTTGFLMKCKNIKEMIGVLAHETGHIAGSHLHKDAMAQASVPAALSLALSIAASVITKNTTPLLAGLSSGSHILERGLLKHSREHEEAADAAAIKLLNALNWPIDGLYSFLETLLQMYGQEKNAYQSTHPLTSERIAKVKQSLSQYKSGSSLPKQWEENFFRMRAKIFGFMQPDKVHSSYTDPTDFPSKYAHAIRLYQKNERAKALEKFNELLKEEPNNSYVLELFGQMQFDSGKIKEAVLHLSRARTLRGKSMGLNCLYAQAVIESGQNLDQAIQALNIVLDQDKNHIFALHLLAMAYGKKGDENCASVILAEIAFLTGNATEATKRLKGSASRCNQPVLKRRASDLGIAQKQS